MRVRHHTSDEGLLAIQASGDLALARGWGNIATGVHVEVEPFGTAWPAPRPASSPVNDMGYNDGAFVDFDAPSNLVIYTCGVQITGIITTDLDFSLAGLNPVFVKVR